MLKYLALLFSLLITTIGFSQSSGYSYKYFGIHTGYLYSNKASLTPLASSATESGKAPSIGIAVNFIDRNYLQFHIEANYVSKSFTVNHKSEPYEVAYDAFQLNPNFRFRYYQIPQLKPFLEIGPFADFHKRSGEWSNNVGFNIGFGVQWIHEQYEFHIRYQYQWGVQALVTDHEPIGQSRDNIASRGFTFGLYRRF